MELTTVLYDVSDHVATVTLSRPEAMNSFNQAMCDEFSLIWRTVREDDDVHVVVLRAAGDRAFCTGVDVRQGFDRHPNVWTQTDPGEQRRPRPPRSPIPATDSGGGVDGRHGDRPEPGEPLPLGSAGGRR